MHTAKLKYIIELLFDKNAIALFRTTAFGIFVGE